jgi:hypothetical protein
LILTLDRSGNFNGLMTTADLKIARRAQLLDRVGVTEIPLPIAASTASAFPVQMQHPATSAMARIRRQRKYRAFTMVAFVSAGELAR